jgi:hypothetical protein
LDEPIFTAPEAWIGGFYELAINLEQRSDEHSRAAMAALLSYPKLDGLYLERNKEPQDQPRVDASGRVEDHHFGVLTLPNGGKLPFGCYIFHLEYEPDWLEVFIPLGSINKFYPTEGYPFNPTMQVYMKWQQEIDLALVDAARHIYRHVSFPSGLIGFELDVDEMEQLYWDSVAELPPDNLHRGYLWAGKNGLEWHPPGEQSNQ